jgi:hypothetical protein
MEGAVIVLKKKPKATKCSDSRTISLFSNTTKVVVRLLRTWNEGKIEDVGLLGEDQFGFRRGKVARDGIRMLRRISERTLEIDEEMRACFLDW